MARQNKEFWLKKISMGVGIFALMFCFFAYTPAKTLIPGYPDAQTRRDAIINAIMVDSLESLISRWELYSENLVRVLEGDKPIPADSIVAFTTRKSISISKEDKAAFDLHDSLLRQEVRDAERFDVSASKPRNLNRDGLHFYVPTKGAISKPFEKHTHPSIEIIPLPGAVILAPLDGTVVFADWVDDGYTIIIQHQSGIVSIIQHAQTLMRKSGDRIAAGATIGLASSNAGEHIHFELWIDGNPADPANYIIF